MAMKEGLSRIAKIISVSARLFLGMAVVCTVSAVATDRDAVVPLAGALTGAALFAFGQITVWILDGFLGNSGSESNLFWPKRRPIFRLHRKSVTDVIPAQAPQLRGVQGWLLLLVIGLMLIGPLRTVIETLNAIGTAESAYPGLVTSPAWGNYKMACWIILIGVCAAMVWAGDGLRKHHIPSSVTSCITVLWAAPTVSVLGNWLASSLFLDISANDYFGGEVLTAMAQQLVCAVVWTAYLKRSRRVKNTYGT